MSEFGSGPGEFISKESIEFRPSVVELLAALGLDKETNEQILSETSRKFNLKENPAGFKGEYQDVVQSNLSQTDEVTIALMVATAELDRIVGNTADAANNLNDAIDYAGYMGLEQFIEKIENLVK